jgi:hypothetical protein
LLKVYPLFTQTPPCRRAAWYLGVALLVAGPGLRADIVRAQEPGLPPPPHALGPVTLAPTIAIRDIGIDTNVYHSASDPVTDLTFSVVPTLGATVRARRLTFTGQADPEFVYFSQQVSERAVNPRLSGAGQLALARLSIAGTTSYVNTRDRPSEEIDARLRHVQKEGFADLRVRVFPRLHVGAFARYSSIDYEPDARYGGVQLAAQLNETSRDLGLSARYVLTPLTTLVATAERERNRFPVAVFRDSDANRYLGGVELQPRALVAGSAMLGQAQFRSRHPLMPSYTGFVGRGNLSLRLRQLTMVGVEFSRDIQYSYSDLSPYYIRGGFSASLRRILTNRWNVQGSAGRYTHRYQYAERPVIDGKLFNADERMLDASIGASYAVRRGTVVDVTLGYGKRDAASLGRRYQGIRLGTSVVYAF